jgi:hypothetical protein
MHERFLRKDYASMSALTIRLLMEEAERDKFKGQLYYVFAS